MDGQLQVPLVVERHRRDLAERVLAVEHPAVGAREQRVGDVADALLDRRVGLGAGAGALDPLGRPEVLGISLPRTRPGVPPDSRARDVSLRVKEKTRMRRPSWLAALEIAVGRPGP